LEPVVFFVPDDFATGREPAVARAEFANLSVVEPRQYVRFALGGALDGIARSVDRVQYLGGDLMHAARVNDRLGGIATSYKFSRARYSDRFQRVFAIDERNREQLLAWKTRSERIVVVGNLAIDAAFYEAELEDSVADRVAEDAIVIMPGARRYEVENMVPFFLRVAQRLREIDSGLPIVFGISPFTTIDELSHALAIGGLPTVYGARGSLVERDGIVYLRDEGGDEFPVVRHAQRAATRARLAVTIPGTKTVELAALGVPTVVTTPFNAPEAVVITGPLQYIERIPVIGVPVKRSLAVRFSKRFTFFAQPNMDSGRELMPELPGTLTPGFVAQRVYERWKDRDWAAAASAEMRVFYAGHRGASHRMAEALAA
ncbi:MAG: hypothetical protein ACREJX_16435, partial [Polyangiaceae bacterium]